MLPLKEKRMEPMLCRLLGFRTNAILNIKMVSFVFEFSLLRIVLSILFKFEAFIKPSE